jgi:hypothetical protein
MGNCLIGVRSQLFDDKRAERLFCRLRALEKFNMFVLSKLMSAITQPMFWLAMWWSLALVMLSMSLSWRRVAVRMLWGGLAVLGLLGFEAVPHSLLRPLENQYPVPAPELVGRHVGVIVLGGPLSTLAFIWRMAKCPWVKRLNACLCRWG